MPAGPAAAPHTCGAAGRLKLRPSCGAGKAHNSMPACAPALVGAQLPRGGGLQLRPAAVVAGALHVAAQLGQGRVQRQERVGGGCSRAGSRGAGGGQQRALLPGQLQQAARQRVWRRLQGGGRGRPGALVVPRRRQQQPGVDDQQRLVHCALLPVDGELNGSGAGPCHLPSDHSMRHVMCERTPTWLGIGRRRQAQQIFVFVPLHGLKE